MLINKVCILLINKKEKDIEHSEQQSGEGYQQQKRIAIVPADLFLEAKVLHQLSGFYEKISGIFFFKGLC